MTLVTCGYEIVMSCLKYLRFNFSDTFCVFSDNVFAFVQIVDIGANLTIYAFDYVVSNIFHLFYYLILSTFTFYVGIEYLQ